MKEREIIKCAFCGGRGTNPFYRGTCPVCKGRGKNVGFAPFVVCSECNGSGKKSGTTLTCFECRGIGVVADTREDIKKARSEIREIQKEMAQEKSELYGKVSKKPRTARDKRPKHLEGGPDSIGDSSEVGESRPRWRDLKETLEERKESQEECFCQSCAQEVHQGSAYKVCEKCFFLYKFGEVREIKPEKEEKEENEG